MNEQSLPQSFEGYSTKELLELWADIPNRKYSDPEEPEEKVLAMHDLLRKYRLLDWNWDDEERLKTDIALAKKLLKPYGIDPAPWADEEGNRQPELEAAWHKKLEQEAIDLPDYDMEYARELEQEAAEAEEARHRQSLPQSFRDYPTADLLELWPQWEKRWESKEEIQEPESKLTAMYALIQAYRLNPEDWGLDEEEETKSEEQGQTDLERAKQLLTPFGFNPKELEAAWTKEWEERGETTSS